jgi:DNA-binding MarR family transcriptional regulator
VLGADRATVVALVDELQRRGFVRRTPNPSDRRAHALRTTPAGLRLLAEADQFMDQCEQDFLSPLTAAGRAALAAALETLLPPAERPLDSQA